MALKHHDVGDVHLGGGMDPNVRPPPPPQYIGIRNLSDF